MSIEVTRYSKSGGGALERASLEVKASGKRTVLVVRAEAIGTMRIYIDHAQAAGIGAALLAEIPLGLVREACPEMAELGKFMGTIEDADYVARKLDALAKGEGQG